MKKDIKFNIYQKRAFSLIELIISISILVGLGLMLTMSISKKAQKVISDAIGGEYSCYKDGNGTLHQRTTLRFNGGKVQFKDSVVTSCKFEFPATARDATIYLIGGGGGGGQVPAFNYRDNCNTVVTPGSFVPLTCSGQYYYRDNTVGAIADCCSERDGEFTCGRVSGIDGNNFQSAECPNIDENIGRTDSLVAPAPTPIRNNLPTYLSDEAYNRFVLSSVTVRNKASGAVLSQTITTARIGDDFICYNGMAETSGNGPTGVTYISPSPGIIQVGNEIFKTQAADWAFADKLNANNYGANDNYGRALRGTGGTDTFSYEAVLLNQCTLPYATNGAAGETVVITHQNLAEKNLSIHADNIGQGGAVGAAGQKTMLSIDRTVREARGGAVGGNGSTDFLMSGEHGVLNGERDSDGHLWPHHHFIRSTNFSDMGALSQYAQNFLLSGAANPAEFRARPFQCTAKGADTVCNNGAAPVGLSYGAGGAGQNSALDYERLLQFTLIRSQMSRRTPLVGTLGTTTDEILPEVIEPRLIVANDVQRNGNGGAIVIRWGD